MDYTNVKQDDKTLNFLTGIPSDSLFQWILPLIRSDVSSILKSFTMNNHLLLILMKLKLGASNRDLSLRFDIKEEYAFKIVRTQLPKLANVFAKLIIWPEREALRENLPHALALLKKCVCIIDCTEIYIEPPLNLNARAQIFSNYKSHNTIKYLIGITPAGAISFLSAGQGERSLDKEITLKSGFLDKLTHADCLLADRGFLVEEKLVTRRAVLRIPAFTRGKKQTTGKDIDISRQIALVRIHVDRVIGRLKKFKILNTTIPIAQLNLTDNIMVTIAGIISLNASFVKK